MQNNNMVGRKQSKWDVWRISSLVILCLFLFFVIYPMFRLFREAFTDSATGAFSLTNFKRFFTEPYYYSTFWNSMKVTLASTIITMILGIGLAYVLNSYEIKGKHFVQFLMIITMLSPPFISAYSWILLFGNQGVITSAIKSLFHIRAKFNIYGFNGILLVFVVKLTPYVYMYVNGALKKVDSSLLEAAESLGYHGLRRMMTVVIPLILPTALAAALVSFANAFADYGTPALIGLNYQVMPTMVYSEYINEVSTNSNISSAMGVLMILFTLLLFIAQKCYIARKTYAAGSVSRPIIPRKASGFSNVMLHIFVYVISFFSMLPQVTIIYVSFLNSNGLRFTGGFTFDNYIKAWKKASSAILNSYKLSFIAIAVIILLGLIIGYVSVRKKGPLASMLDTCVMVPFIVPGAILGIMLIKTFNSGTFILTGTGLIIIVAYVMRRMMYTVRSSSAILYQISPSLEEASISLGYSPSKTFMRITGRLMLSGVLSGAVISWIACINELSSSLMLYNANTKTMSIYIYLEASRGYLADAAGMAAIMCYSLIISVFLLMKLTGSKDITV